MNMNILTPEQEIKIREFYKWLGPRFKEIHNASEGAPIDICAIDNEDKEYWIKLTNKLSESVSSIEFTGVTIENTHFYQLYAMVSNDQSVFYMELFKDGFALFFLNDLTPEQLKVTDEVTMIGITSALHVEVPKENVPHTTPQYTYVNTAPITLPELPKLKKV